MSVSLAPAATTVPDGAGPTFRFSDQQLPPTVTVVTYGDQRFTDPENTTATNPKVRKFLVDAIAAEHPAAIILNGDVPLAGSNVEDYSVYNAETEVWRAAHLLIFPALGNHELHGDLPICLENWWKAFPELRDRRWYSVQLGSYVYVLALDSDSPLVKESQQAQWIDEQIKNLPATVQFVIVTMHHPPVADVQTAIHVDHNPRTNEIAFRDYLAQASGTSRAVFLVSAGHIHNYERAEYAGTTYLVSGGGGAKPYPVERTSQDLYKNDLFPNYHFVKLTLGTGQLHGEMYRVEDPDAITLHLRVQDRFDLKAKKGVSSGDRP